MNDHAPIAAGTLHALLNPPHHGVMVSPEQRNLLQQMQPLAKQLTAQCTMIQQLLNTPQNELLNTTYLCHITTQMPANAGQLIADNPVQGASGLFSEQIDRLLAVPEGQPNAPYRLQNFRVAYQKMLRFIDPPLLLLEEALKTSIIPSLANSQDCGKAGVNADLLTQAHRLQQSIAGLEPILSALRPLSQSFVDTLPDKSPKGLGFR